LSRPHRSTPGAGAFRRGLPRRAGRQAIALIEKANDPKEIRELKKQQYLGEALFFHAAELHTVVMQGEKEYVQDTGFWVFKSDNHEGAVKTSEVENVLNSIKATWEQIGHKTEINDRKIISLFRTVESTIGKSSGAGSTFNPLMPDS
jgi:hypothetical protein